MQQILNSQERNQAFLKFLIYFIITVIMVVLAVYFDYKVPAKENTWLQGQLDIQQIQDGNQIKFVSKMEEAVALMDQWNNKDVDNALIDTKLNKIIGDMSLIEQSDKSIYGKMNKAIVAKFNDLRNAKNELIKSKGATDEVTNLKNDLKTCEFQLSQARLTIATYEKTNP